MDFNREYDVEETRSKLPDIPPPQLEYKPNKLVFLNDTRRTVSIHPATIAHGISCDETDIEHLQTRTFILPRETYPWVKMWDYGQGHGLQILVSYAKE